MSIKFPRNKIKTFGSKLPTLYFEKIEVYNTKYKLQLALYSDGNIGEQEDYERYYRDYIKKLNYYVMLVLEGTTPSQFDTSSMPPPMVSIDVATRPDPLDAMLHPEWYTDWYTSVQGAISSMGLEVSEAAGSWTTLNGGTIQLVTDHNLSYTPKVPNYYKPEEIGQYTNRIKRLKEGQVSVFDLVRRNNDYKFPCSPSVQAPIDIFTDSGTRTNERISATRTTDDDNWSNKVITLNNLYTNPYTDPEGHYDVTGIKLSSLEFSSTSTPSAESYGVVFSDPNLTDDSIGHVVVYPPNKGNQGNIIQISLDDFSDDYEIIRNKDGSIVYKHTYEVDFAFASDSGQYFDGAVDSESSSGGGFYETYSFSSFIDQLHRIPETYLLAFSSLIDIDITGGNTNYIHNAISAADVIDDPITQALTKRAIAKFNTTLTSDIVYEKVSSYNIIQPSQLDIFVDANGDEYDGDAIQSTNLSYYGVDGVTLEGIVANFENLFASNVGRAANTDDQISLDTIKNEIQTVLVTHKKDSKLLPALDAIRQNFTDTSRSTATGRFYKEFRDYINNTNAVVVNGEQLRKQRAINPILADRRSVSNTGLWKDTLLKDTIHYGTGESLEDPPSVEFVNPYMALVSKFADRYTEEYTHSLDGSTDLMDIYINGFYFFDYEKAIQAASNLNNILNVAKVEKHYGREITQNHFKLASNTVEQNRLVRDGTRYTYTESDGEWYRNESPDESGIGQPNPNYHTGDVFPQTFIPEDPTSGLVSTTKALYDTNSNSTAPTLQKVEVNTNGDAFSERNNDGIVKPRTVVISDTDARLGPENEVLNLDAGEYEYTYTYLRNIEFTNPLKINGLPYRLMGFEFQNVIPSQDTTADYEATYNDYLEFSVSVEDDTQKVYEAMTLVFSEALELLKEYAEAAAEFCSYNDLDGQFNKFFADYQNQMYDEQGTAPWHFMPVLYRTHLDIVTDKYGGNSDQVLAAAIKDSEAISPETGNLDNLAFYVDLVNTFYQTYYVIGGEDNPTSAYDAGDFSNVRHSITKSFGGGDNGETADIAGYPKRASTYFPLPKLEEVLIEPPTYGATTSGETYANLRMVKMKFGFFNVPSGLTPNQSTQYQSDQDEYPVTFKPTIRITPSADNIGKKINGIDITEENLYQLLLPTQFTTEGESFQSINWSADYRAPTHDNAMLYYDTKIGNAEVYLADAGWTDANRLAVGTSNQNQNRAATAGANSATIWLHAGAMYDVVWGMVESKTYYLDDENVRAVFDRIGGLSRWIWHSETLVAKIPLIGMENKTDVELTGLSADGNTDQGSTNQFNQYYLDCSNLVKSEDPINYIEVGNDTIADDEWYETGNVSFSGTAKIMARNNMTDLSGDQIEVSQRWTPNASGEYVFLGSWGVGAEFWQNYDRGPAPVDTSRFGVDDSVDFKWYTNFTSDDLQGYELKDLGLNWESLAGESWQGYRATNIALFGAIGTTLLIDDSDDSEDSEGGTLPGIIERE